MTKYSGGGLNSFIDDFGPLLLLQGVRSTGDLIIRGINDPAKQAIGISYGDDPLHRSIFELQTGRMLNIAPGLHPILRACWDVMPQDGVDTSRNGFQREVLPPTSGSLVRTLVYPLKNQLYQITIRGINLNLQADPIIPGVLLQAVAVTETLQKQRRREFEDALTEAGLLGEVEEDVYSTLVRGRINGKGIMEFSGASQDLLKTLGVDRETFIAAGGLNCFVHSKDLHLLKELDEIIKLGGSPEDMRIRLLSADGSYRTFKLDIKSFFEEDAHSVRAIIKLIDITDQIYAENRLEVSLEKSLAGKIFISRDGKVIKANPAADELSQYFAQKEISEGDELLGITICPDTRAGFEAGLLKCFKGEEVEFEIQVGVPKVLDNGKHLRFNISPIFGADGSIREALVQILDVSIYKERIGLLKVQAEKLILDAQYLELQSETNRKLLQGVISVIVPIIERVDDLLHPGHTRRVSGTARRFAEFLSETGIVRYFFTDEDLDLFQIATLLHDIGKVDVPLKLLMSDQVLEGVDRERLKDHVTVPEKSMLKNLLEIPEVRRILEVIKYHHARYDGNLIEGFIYRKRKLRATYPIEEINGERRALTGEEIPLWARIFTPCDSYDAARSKRTYKPAKSKWEVLLEIIEDAGQLLDPRIASLFVRFKLQDDDDEAYGSIDGYDHETPLELREKYTREKVIKALRNLDRKLAEQARKQQKKKESEVQLK